MIEIQKILAIFFWQTTTITKLKKKIFTLKYETFWLIKQNKTKAENNRDVDHHNIKKKCNKGKYCLTLFIFHHSTLQNISLYLFLLLLTGLNQQIFCLSIRKRISLPCFHNFLLIQSTQSCENCFFFLKLFLKKMIQFFVFKLPVLKLDILYKCNRQPFCFGCFFLAIYRQIKFLSSFPVVMIFFYLNSHT